MQQLDCCMCWVNHWLCYHFATPLGACRSAGGAFISRFLALTRDTHLAYLASDSSPAGQALHASLQNITGNGFGWLKGYLAGLEGTYGELTYGAMEADPTQAPVIAYVAGQVQVSLAAQCGASQRRRRRGRELPARGSRRACSEALGWPH